MLQPVLQKLPVKYYQDQRTGDLMSRATNDLASVRMLIGPAVIFRDVLIGKPDTALMHDDTIDRVLTRNGGYDPLFPRRQ